MRVPTDEQAAVLGHPARIRVVRAAPGSGKTWLVAEAIRRALDTWSNPCAGIAALSFTRVGGEEIKKAIGYELDHPHFVGTLDAFVFRYVIRPFLQQVYPNYKRPRLIPADWVPGHWTKGPANVRLDVPRLKGSQGKPYKILDACFIGQKHSGYVIGHPAPFRSGLEELPVQAANAVFNAKRRLWGAVGWLTHSDAAFLASQILADQDIGAVVVAEVVRRFPLLIVDELQDTGWFLGKTIEGILNHSLVRGLLVGDPDQAIYEFNGARPDLFDRFKGLTDAEELQLNKTQRCSAAVCRVAEALSQSGRTVSERDSSTGRAILISYDDLNPDMTMLRERLQNDRPHLVVKLLARHRNTIEVLTGRSARPTPALGSPVLNHMHRAVAEFRVGRQARALACARAALELAVFDQQGVVDEVLHNAGIEPASWKRTAVECLLKANHEVIGETFFDWGCRTADDIRQHVAQLAAETTSSIKTPNIRRPQKKLQSAQRDGYLFQPSAAGQAGPSIAPQTVHSVKGETHDLTVLICPPPKQVSRCPSQVWWSSAPADLEERRIAFVAMSRSRGDLIVCMTRQSLSRLQSDRASFVSRFETMSIDEFLSQWETTQS